MSIEKEYLSFLLSHLSSIIKYGIINFNRHFAR